MTVRSIVEMFESMAASTDDGASTHSLESPERGNVYGLVTYYDALAVVEETPIILPTKIVRIGRDLAVVSAEVELESVEQTQEQEQIEQEPQEQEQEQEQEQIEQEPQEQIKEEQQEQVEKKAEEQQEDNQDTSEVPTAPVSSPARLERSFLLPVSKIPQPKSREFHLAACSVRKPCAEDSSRTRTFSSNSNDANQQLYVPPPTPISARIRAPCTSYAAFVTRIENSTSRLLDFEKDERWLGQVETMKGRVETLKRRNHLNLAREVACTPRKNRSMSECSGVSTASTASMSSMDTPEVTCQ
ncbi:hypothetical protein P3T76_002705 [Phytophthora citrophthora]|uniref:Uncharacterized protein n=1 Tax=Phytophthora citrophthora TaxID=4793 RepID=A0AAD9GW15_9STRA|nr:hypothetical protein P3T76_002705 [Phytophthora citrophthora]